MTAPSPGNGLNANAPPNVPDIAAVPPSQVEVIAKSGTSDTSTTKLKTGIGETLKHVASVTDSTRTYMGSGLNKLV
ncbi:MAG: hypothetical protein GY703_05600 [Gammaproteobacteria bacterium]|nr:hypothetical protein [Gammaproteobacteria bacterium]